MKNKLISGILICMLVLGMAVALSACDGAAAGESKIDTMTSSTQITNNVTVTNYQITLKADVSWDNLNTNDKMGIVEAGVAKARAQADVDDVNNFNILGVSKDGKVVFLYDREHEQVRCYTNGNPDGLIFAVPKDGKASLVQEAGSTGNTGTTTTPPTNDKPADTGQTAPEGNQAAPEGEQPAGGAEQPNGEGGAEQPAPEGEQPAAPEGEQPAGGAAQ